MEPSAFWQTEWGKLLRNTAVNQPGSRVHKEFIAEFRVPFSVLRTQSKTAKTKSGNDHLQGRVKRNETDLLFLLKARI